MASGEGEEIEITQRGRVNRGARRRGHDVSWPYKGKGKSGIRPEMAIRLSKAFGSTAET